MLTKLKRPPAYDSKRTEFGLTPAKARVLQAKQLILGNAMHLTRRHFAAPAATGTCVATDAPRRRGRGCAAAPPRDIALAADRAAGTPCHKEPGGAGCCRQAGAAA